MPPCTWTWSGLAPPGAPSARSRHHQPDLYLLRMDRGPWHPSMVLLHRHRSILEPGSGVRVLPSERYTLAFIRQSIETASGTRYVRLPVLRPLLRTRPTCSPPAHASSCSLHQNARQSSPPHRQRATPLPMIICLLFLGILCAVPRVGVALRFDGDADAEIEDDDHDRPRVLPLRRQTKSGQQNRTGGQAETASSSRHVFCSSLFHRPSSRSCSSPCRRRRR
jgi:hypothetical protein